MQRMEEETNVNVYIVTQKLPKEIESKKKVVASLAQATGQPALGQVIFYFTGLRHVLMRKWVSKPVQLLFRAQSIWSL